MAGSIDKLCERMRYWCDQANVGYDQSNRWDVRNGGETDCSALVITCLREAGFETGSASYTGNMSAELCKHGWKRIKNDGKPRKGDILLKDGSHVAVYVGNGLMSYASIDERGKASGGKSGDQTGRETRTTAYHDYPWSCYLRHESVASSNVSGANTTNTNGGFDVATLATIKNGSTGAQVKSLQALLNTKNKAGLVVDGAAGLKTVAAIKNYQKAKGLDVDGQCGNDTWSKILTT